MAASENGCIHVSNWSPCNLPEWLYSLLPVAQEPSVTFLRYIACGMVNIARLKDSTKTEPDTGSIIAAKNDHNRTTWTRYGFDFAGQLKKSHKIPPLPVYEVLDSMGGDVEFILHLNSQDTLIDINSSNQYRL